MKISRLSPRSIAYLILISPLILAGCSQKFQNNADTLKAAWELTSDAQLSNDKIRALPYASIFLRVNGGARVFIALAFAEKDKSSKSIELKWLSKDKVLITTENGRITKTLGLDTDNLANLHITNLNHLPLSYDKIGQNGQMIYDWQPNFRYNFVALATQKDLGYEDLSTPLWKGKTHHIAEIISFPTLRARFQNEYWVDKQNRVIKTIQFLGPDMDKLEITFIKPYIAP